MDDFLVIGRKQQAVNGFKSKLMEVFAMTDIGLISNFLGVRITRDFENKKIYLTQDAYILKILEKFHLQNTTPTKTPIRANTDIELIPYDGVASKEATHYF